MVQRCTHKNLLKIDLGPRWSSHRTYFVADTFCVFLRDYYLIVRHIYSAASVGGRRAVIATESGVGAVSPVVSGGAQRPLRIWSGGCPIYYPGPHWAARAICLTGIRDWDGHVLVAVYWRRLLLILLPLGLYGGQGVWSRSLCLPEAVLCVMCQVSHP